VKDLSTNTHEIADKVYRFSTCVEGAAPGGFTFNQFLIVAEQPLLFHTGPRKMFPLVKAAIERVMPISKLRWIAFGHVEADECGSMNELLALAPEAEVMHGALGCMVSLNDLCDRAPKALANGEVMDLGGGKRVRHVDTPHVPHNWEARVLFEESTRTLFCGDLFSHGGDGPALTSSTSIVDMAIGMEEAMNASALTATTGPTIRGLASLEAKTLAIMHGSSFDGDCGAALSSLADYYEKRAKA